MNDKIKKIILKNTPQILHQLEKDIYHNVIYFNFRETKKHFGELNKDKTFYIIRKTEPGSGLMSEWMFVLDHLIKAKKRGVVPFVELSINRFCGEKNQDFELKNVWEYYWEQPSKYRMAEIYQSKNIILSQGWPNHNFVTINALSDIKRLKEFCDASKSVPLKNEVITHINKVMPSAFFNDNKKIIGVNFRGSGFTINQLSEHAIQPDVSRMLDLTSHQLKKWNADTIYIKAEEQYVIDLFKKEFGEIVIHSNNRRFAEFKSGEEFEDLYADNPYPTYMNGLEYLSEIVMLSKCNYLIGALNTGTIAAIIMNDLKYKDVYLDDLGRY